MSPVLSNWLRTLRQGRSWGLGIGLCVLAFAAVGLVVYGLGEKQPRFSAPTVARAVVQLPLAAARGIATPGAGHGTPLTTSAVRAQLAAEANLARALAGLGRPGDPPEADARVTGAGADLRGIARDLQVSVDEDSPSGTYRVSLAYASQDPGFSARLVNALAVQYAKDCRGQLQEGVREAAEEARRAAERARADLARLKSEFDALAESRFQAQKTAARPARSGPGEAASSKRTPGRIASQAGKPSSVRTIVNNPEWIERTRELDGLRQRRSALLEDRTPLHPEVQDLDLRIAGLVRDLEAIPREVAGRAAPPPSEPEEGTSQPIPADPREPVSRDLAAGPGGPEAEAEALRLFRVQKERLDAAAERVEQLLSRERAATEAGLRLPQIEVMGANSPHETLSPRPSSRWAWTAILAALGAAAGVGLISHGAAIDTPLRSPAEVKASLPIPLVASIPADASDRPAQQAGAWTADRSLWIVLGILVIAVCALVVLRLGAWI